MRHVAHVLICLILTCPAWSATYRADGMAGNDANDGLAAPFQTIARGLQVLKPGDTLLLTKLAQPYRESIPLNVHGRPDAPIIIDGGGATISGADPAPREGWQDNAGVFTIAQPTEVKFLFGPDCRYEMAAAPDKLQPEQWVWKEGKLYFRPAAAKTPADYDLQMSVRISGILTNGAGQIIVRNLTAMHFYNDGFNIHGGSAPLWFENIRGLWNGDEGFSCHENVEAYVRGAEFSHNYWHGIADVGIARTHYQNIVCRDNRAKGIYLLGSMHSISDSEVSGSPQQIVLSPSDQRGYPQWDLMPLRTSLTSLRNVVVRSRPGETGIVVTAGASAVIEHCVVLGGKTCLQVDDGGAAYVLNSIIANGEAAEVTAAGTYAAESNLYFPGRLVIKGTTYGPEQFAQYVAATGNDQKSFVEEPRFIGDTLTASKASHAAGGALNAYGFGGPDIGLELRGPRPAETGVQAAPPAARDIAATGGAVAGQAIVYDFETHHPWSLVYPEPEKTPAGAAVVGRSELSADQAHGGKQAGRLSVTLPPGPPNSFTIKLFSEKLPYSRPVVVWRFWLYGDGSGRRIGMRVRDARGENFYRAPLQMDWTAWKQISWNLTQEPPVTVAGGDGNKQQDGPPMELVLNFGAKPGEQLTLYVDDLEVELAP